MAAPATSSSLNLNQPRSLRACTATRSMGRMLASAMTPSFRVQKQLRWPAAATARPPGRGVVCAADGIAAGSDQAKKGKKRAVVAGLDLGTTNSAIAVLENRIPTMVPVGGEKVTMPSVVAYTKDGTVLVGELAKRQAVLNPSNTFGSVKRFIGRQRSEVNAEAKQVAYSIEEDEFGDVQLVCPHVEEGRLAPEEVSAQVVTRMLEHAGEHAGGVVEKCVITVPAYFNDEQKDATVRAGMIAGLETVRVVREPNAAALAYGLGKERDETILVFDLGGGTFDVSVLEVGGGVVEVLSTGGDSQLGGDDFNKRIVDFIAKEAAKAGAKDPMRDPRLLQQVTDASEAAKCRLSSAKEVALTLPLVTTEDGSGLKIRITRNLLDSLCAEELRRMRLPVEQACLQAGVDLSDHLDGTSIKAAKANNQGKRPNSGRSLTQVILVGGATRMPSVQRFIANMTGLDPHFTVNPDEAVALGAAVQAGILNGDVSDLYVMDVWQASLMRGLAEWQIKAQAEAAGGGEEKEEEEGWGEEGDDGGEGQEGVEREEGGAGAGGVPATG